ncbi:hypothetical protein ACQ4LE_009383 [Meloidogyne hapla]
MRSVKTFYPFNSSSTSIEKQRIFRQEGRDVFAAVRLAQTATALLVVVCFLGLPIFWLQIMVRFTTIHLLHLQNQQLRQQNYLTCRIQNRTDDNNNNSDGNIIFSATFEDNQSKGNVQKYECDPWGEIMQL